MAQPTDTDILDLADRIRQLTDVEKHIQRRAEETAQHNKRKAELLKEISDRREYIAAGKAYPTPEAK